LDAVERRSGCNKQSSAVPATEDETGGALRDSDGVDVFAGGIEDEDLAGCDIYISTLIYYDVLAAFLDKQLRLGECPIGPNFEGLRLQFCFIGDVEGLSCHGGCYPEGTQKVRQLGAPLNGPGSEVSAGWNKGGSVGRDIVRWLL